ncbi:MAG: DUF3300 domain-containing protein [Methylicorpusculum sp.]|uniref:DUF3300 domain-containing protein n=1 Tax=Methylicorpusculum sp. TaxID=2713644 RepID=UPI00271FBDBC|nr:DUF3300 domain-containing protein [Methylicorpusculum sp.]MDO8939109.1 DUF3300 domain-containing protein [Methylicorpusculum sp.]MDO9238965.1 DUF3300 domain-containing protein [Methylicorpusculum sp.]MDP2200692.1 DUF3300 domain-containing protein [Methylicorpusculum sp.]
MNHLKSTNDPYYCSAVLCRALLIALIILPAGCNKDDQESSKSPPTQPSAEQGVPPTDPMPVEQAPVVPVQPLTSLESLVAPIALYPDPLLAEMLVASSYPLEIVQAARWLESKPDLATLSTKNWDASIMRLASVPLVIKMMNDHLDWTTQLGDAFLANPSEVMGVIQALRKRAVDSGYLKDTPEQKVTAQMVSVEDKSTETSPSDVTPAVLKKEVITITPAKSDTIYVPQYKPEVVYQATMAPPPTSTVYPTSTVVNVNSAPAPSYYPAYYPPQATSTSSNNDTLANFATGAVVGGLLTWAIMEWADDDDYHVSHYYGNSVCHSGNCWYGGGGGGYYGDRGNVNYNKNINISGNEINVGGGNTFSQNNLRPAQQPAGWRPDPQHRRGQAFPEAAQKRLGKIQQPALAGQRLGAAQTLPATARGFDGAGQRPAVGTLPAQSRPSTADIRQQLGQKPGAQDKPGLKQAKNKPATRDIQTQLAKGSRGNALAGIKTPGQASRLESQRGSNSRQAAQSALRGGQTRKPVNAGGMGAQNSPGRFDQAKPAAHTQSLGRERTQQQITTQRRSEVSRPNAFEAPRSAGATKSFSQRGASSRSQATSSGNLRASGGGGGARSGGGGGRRR